MTVTVREAGPFERLVGFELTDGEIEAAKSAAARRLSQDLKLKGFRPGKAPRPVVEAAVGSARLRTEAIEDAIPPKLGEVLTSEDLAPVTQPELANIEDIEGGVAVEIKITLWPHLDTPPSYRDRKIEMDSPEVTDEEVETQVDRMREQFGQVEEVERPAADGDYLSIDVSASANGEPMEDATATELLYHLGSGGLVEGADAALVGAVAGDSVTITAPLPEGFSGDVVEADFEIVVNEVKELILPDLDDEWVDENTEFETVDEFRANLRTRIEEAKQSSLARRFTDRVLTTLVEQVEIEIPDAVMRAEADEILHRFIHRLEGQEISLEDYFNATGITQEMFLGDLMGQADRSLRTRILLDAIIEDAGIEVSEAEVDEVLHGVASQSNDPLGFLKAIRGTPQELSLRSDMLRDKAIEMIIANATAVDPDGNEIAIDLDGPEDQAVEGEVVAGEIVEGEIVEGEVVEAGVVVTEATDQEK